MKEPFTFPTVTGAFVVTEICTIGFRHNGGSYATLAFEWRGGPGLLLMTPTARECQGTNVDLKLIRRTRFLRRSGQVFLISIYHQVFSSFNTVKCSALVHLASGQLNQCFEIYVVQ